MNQHQDPTNCASTSISSLVFSDNSSQGFSLLEAMVSLLVLFAMMAGLLPIFMSWRISTINNSIKTGAIAISQQILDELRQDSNVNSWSNSGSETSLPSGRSIASIDYEGKTYNASISYCTNSSFCDLYTRHVTLDVSHNNDTIYSIQTVYTNFE